MTSHRNGEFGGKSETNGAEQTEDLAGHGDRAGQELVEGKMVVVEEELPDRVSGDCEHTTAVCGEEVVTTEVEGEQVCLNLQATSRSTSEDTENNQGRGKLDTI